MWKGERVVNSCSFFHQDVCLSVRLSVFSSHVDERIDQRALIAEWRREKKREDEEEEGKLSFLFERGKKFSDQIERWQTR